MAATTRLRLGLFIGGGLVIALALAFFVSPQASGDPDGLNKVAIDEGFADTETEHDLADVPTAGYAVEGVDDDRLSTGLSGLIGVTVTFVVGAGVVLLMRRARTSPDGAAATGAGAGAGTT